MTAIDSLELASRGLQELEGNEITVVISLPENRFIQLKEEIEDEYPLACVIACNDANKIEKKPYHSLTLHGVSFTFHLLD